MSDFHDQIEEDAGREGIAIVGMAGRFPGASDVATFWENIKAGRETITHFDLSELELDLPTGPDAPPLEDYVCAKGMLDDIDMFDARYFGYLPREAEVMDPQHRVFLEICHEALEHAAYDPARYDGAIGVYGGCYMDTYLLANLCADDAFRRQLVESIQVGTLQTELGNDKDYLATRVAFKLGLTGPAMTMQTACSTSLVALVTACQSLDAFQADMMLAGGVTIVLPQKKGYFYKEGSILAPDGHCRTFDENSAGTVFSNGAAVLLLKRLEDALADRDTIYGVIRGYAANNDGGTKVSYTAPSVEGQAEVISQALGFADIDAGTMGYVEAHGTATPIGDPIEIRGLTTAYRESTDRTQYCAIGSVKANLGHLDVASGAIGTIKAALCLHEKVLTPQINFTRPNPKIGIEETPFFINTALRPWEQASYPRRAGVSSFGVGGTNAHIVIEEAPDLAPRSFKTRPHILPLSAKTDSALATAATDLADFMEEQTDIPLHDIAYSLQQGRQEHARRRIAVGETREELIAALRRTPGPADSAKIIGSSPELVFLFPGQGAQYPGMGRALYKAEPVYREVVDEISDTLLADPGFGTDLRDYLLWSAESEMNRETATARLAETWLTQPALFAVEIGMARLLESWGLRPAAVLGHSIGEVAAACLAGVFSLGDATRLVAARGRLMWQMPAGQMLAVLLPQEDVVGRLPDGVSIAAVNAPGATVVSGPTEVITAFAETLAADGVKAKLLATSHAFHSAMMAAAEGPLREVVAGLAGAAASMAIYSTSDGGRVAPNRLGAPDYWGGQMMRPVLFRDALVQAAEDGANRVFIEVGPGQALAAFTRQSLTGESKRPVLSALAAEADGVDADLCLARLAGQAWTHGVRPDWQHFHDPAARRVALPTYPFERKRFWVDPAATRPGSETATIPASAPGGPDATPTPVPPTQNQPALDEVERLIQQQIDLVSQQLKAMQGR